MKPIDKRPTSKKPKRNSKLAEQLGKRDAFDLIEEELYLSLIRTVDLLSTSFTELFQQHGLSGPLYNALRIVAGQCKVDSHGVTVGTIASRLVCRNPDTTRLVDRLENLGYVVCVTCPEDARRRMVRITSSGESVIKALHRPMRELHKRQFSQLDEKNQLKLLRTLESIRSHLPS